MTTAIGGGAEPRAADERRAVLWAAAAHFCLFAGYYLVRPLRDAMGLRGQVRALPWLFAATLAVMLLVNPPFAALVRRLPRRRLAPAIYFAIVASLIGFYVVLGVSPSPWAARAFFVWASVLNLFAVSVFWGVMADRFVPAAAARHYGVIAFGGTLGAMVGSALASAAGRHAPLALLLGGALGLAAAAVCLRRLVRLPLVGGAPERGDGVRAEAERAARAANDSPAARPPAAIAFLVDVVRSPYLLGIALYILCYTLSSTFAYLLQARVVAVAIADEAARTALFARMDLWVNLVSLVVQLVGTRALVRRLGVTGTLAILPLVTLVGFALVLAGPSLTALVLFQVLRRSSDYAAARPARELLFTVVEREQKYPAKSFIDTFVYRGGDAIGAGLFGAGGSFGAWLALPLCLVWLCSVPLLGRRYEQARRAQRPAACG